MGLRVKQPEHPLHSYVVFRLHKCMYVCMYVYIYIYLYIYLRVSQTLVGLIAAPHACTHRDGRRLTPGGVDARASGVETQCPNRANTRLGILMYFNLS